MAGSWLRVLISISWVAAIGCARDEPPASPAPPAPAFDPAGTRFVDLSHAYDQETVFWPSGEQRFALEQLAYGTNEQGFFYSAYSLCTPEHGGTHIDAPIHFAQGGTTVDRIPLERLIVPAVVIDLRAQAQGDRDYRLTPADVAAFEARHGRVDAGSAVLLRTGWSTRWPNVLEYLGDDTPGDASRLHFPSFGLEAAQLLIKERGVVLLGVDTASIDHGPAHDFPVHRLAGGNDVAGLENLTGLDQLPERGAWIAALPMKIGGGSGAPVRVVAFVPR